MPETPQQIACSNPLEMYQRDDVITVWKYIS